MPNNAAPYLNLETINKDGRIPESRLNDPVAVQQIVQQMISANEKRSKVDAKVYGMISGFPPYSPAKLRENGEAWRHNFNSRIGEAFLNVALTSYWDSYSEAPTKAQVRTDYGNEDQREDWSGIITDEFERLNQEDTKLNYMVRLSQHDMVLYRCGPVMFEDAYNFKARAIKQCNLLADDGSPSNVDDWIISIARVSYQADELYAFIRNPTAATKIGYNVKAVRQALLYYTPTSFWPRNTRGRDWEYYEQRIRNNDIYISRISDEIPVAHVFYREFPKPGDTCGRISHCMVLEEGDPSEFLFRSVGRFEKWQNVIHPFYYDTGDGTHHSVKGLGIKAYAMLEAYNRMQCHIADAAMFGSSLHFQARDMASMQNLAVQAMGPYIVHAPGTELLPTQLGAQLEAPMAIKQDFINTLTSNLAQYRQDVQRRRQGSEPPTARQINYESENESVIGRSGMSWYFEQFDGFWEERYRRASNLNITLANLGGKEALAFQDRCIKRGVPREALVKIEYVRATRTIGYGSADNRMQALMRLMAQYPLYDENGKRKILEAVTAAQVGYSNMRQFITKSGDSSYNADQRCEATQWVSSMKAGVSPVMSPSQNPVIYSGIWLKASADVASSLQQGANPAEVFGFLEVAGPAIRQQLDRFASDPTRKEIYDAFNEQWVKLSGLHDKLGSQLQQQAQAQQKRQMQMAQQQNQVNGELAIKAQESQGKLAISREKQQANLRLKEEVHNQRLRHSEQDAQQSAAIADVTTATQIRNKTLETRASVRNKTKAE